eukprot:CAMPEP_0177630370 /NCGR_PEP_ID=MMETSP0447-20121125/1175_1 /TAXON_ID=0 /ORGANISM="Stygamoeba regulata, Strain BSH-02190019" /LENGTH=680 /DNA_ID=CAMNT_0019131773 /DNA_START=131 /DNA_END=2173 /DNA_ORIENTATION=+
MAEDADGDVDVAVDGGWLVGAVEEDAEVEIGAFVEQEEEVGSSEKEEEDDEEKETQMGAICSKGAGNKEEKDGVASTGGAATGADDTEPSSPRHDYRANPNEAEEDAAAERPVLLSKDIIDFGSEVVQAGESATDQITLTLRGAGKKKSGKEKASAVRSSVAFRFEPCSAKGARFTFTPDHGRLTKRRPEVHVQVNVQVQASENLNFRTWLVLDDEERLFLTVKVHCEPGVFGSDPSTLEQAPYRNFTVPRILIRMRECLEQNDAFHEEGIFRLAGDAEEIKRLKSLMNRKKFEGSDDINTIANLIKIWFRDLPVPLLNHIEADSILDEDPDACVNAYKTQLPPEAKNLLDWLIDLIGDVSALHEVNKMTRRNLSIVIAPNLYEPQSVDPMRGLVLSQKCVSFLLNVVNYRLDTPTSVSKSRSSTGSESSIEEVAVATKRAKSATQNEEEATATATENIDGKKEESEQSVSESEDEEQVSVKSHSSSGSSPSEELPVPGSDSEEGESSSSSSSSAHSSGEREESHANHSEEKRNNSDGNRSDAASEEDEQSQPATSPSGDPIVDDDRHHKDTRDQNAHVQLSRDAPVVDSSDADSSEKTNRPDLTAGEHAASSSSSSSFNTTSGSEDEPRNVNDSKSSKKVDPSTSSESAPVSDAGEGEGEQEPDLSENDLSESETSTSE